MKYDIKAELLYKLEELIKLIREQSTYAGIYTFTEPTDEIASLEKQIAKENQCHAIYEKVKEAWTPDKIVPGTLGGAWECPRCHKIHAWFSKECDCPPSVITSNTYNQ
jgi:hypothetical protein